MRYFCLFIYIWGKPASISSWMKNPHFCLSNTLLSHLAASSNRHDIC